MSLVNVESKRSVFAVLTKLEPEPTATYKGEPKGSVWDAKRNTFRHKNKKLKPFPTFKSDDIPKALTWAQRFKKRRVRA